MNNDEAIYLRFSEADRAKAFTTINDVCISLGYERISPESLTDIRDQLHNRYEQDIGGHHYNEVRFAYHVVEAGFRALLGPKESA